MENETNVKEVSELVNLRNESILLNSDLAKANEEISLLNTKLEYLTGEQLKKREVETFEENSSNIRIMLQGIKKMNSALKTNQKGAELKQGKLMKCNPDFEYETTQEWWDFINKEFAESVKGEEEAHEVGVMEIVSKADRLNKQNRIIDERHNLKTKDEFTETLKEIKEKHG